ncbi:MAG: dethiobiotin synthase [Chitinophagales bacterium]|nr:dethiobiotin synthase [Chitinophagales bacterium]MDW8419346.1 dethiobiotin synthase [Chitinophagales bacterium]
MRSRFPDFVFVTGIGTGVGKTIASTVLCNALRADYWKPVQTGSATDSDSDFVRKHVDFNICVHPERYRLREPASPHYAAQAENTEILLRQITMPQTDNRLIIEGAGGLLVPLNRSHTILDLIVHLQAPVILVANEYLGSINHTLLSLQALHHRRLKLLGILFTGKPYLDNQDIILEMAKCRNLGRVPHTDNLNREFFTVQGESLRAYLQQYFDL